EPPRCRRTPRPRFGFRSARSSPLRASHPSQGETSACSFRFPPLSPTEGFLGLAVRFICSNHEYAIRIFVRHVEDLQEAAGPREAGHPLSGIKEARAAAFAS